MLGGSEVGLEFRLLIFVVYTTVWINHFPRTKWQATLIVKPLICVFHSYLRTHNAVGRPAVFFTWCPLFRCIPKPSHCAVDFAQSHRWLEVKMGFSCEGPQKNVCFTPIVQAVACTIGQCCPSRQLPWLTYKTRRVLRSFVRQMYALKPYHRKQRMTHLRKDELNFASQLVDRRVERLLRRQEGAD